MKKIPKTPYPQRPKDPIEMTSDELLDHVLEPELAEAVKREANPPEESTDSEQEC